MRTCLAPGPLGLEPSFGFGDRLGLGTPGHIAALREAGGSIRGIFAQQSVREMARTRREPNEVMQAAVDALSAAEFTDPWSADADHLKTAADIQRTADAGFVFFTLDPSDDVDQRADAYDEPTLRQEFDAVREHAPWAERCVGRSVRLDAGEITFDRMTVERAAVKYGKAIRKALELAAAVKADAQRRRQPWELELSVDETPEPTTPAEHYLIAEQFQQAGLPLVSLAPRFIGDFEKGVDYKGDLGLLERSLRMHAEIARRMGPYKLSLHSGSDKLSMYGLLARATDGRFHVKTAGTSYLEALRVSAQCDADLFREIVAFSREHYDRDKATYHVSATLENCPRPDEASPVELERFYLERWDETPEGRGFTQPGRQILHCTFGSVLTDERLGGRLMDLLTDNAEAYREVLREHFVRHLRALQP